MLEKDIMLWARDEAWNSTFACDVAISSLVKRFTF
jgi:hypothetical protein